MREDVDKVPTLQTTRLTLRGPGLADFAASAALWADPEVTRFIMGWPNPPGPAPRKSAE